MKTLTIVLLVGICVVTGFHPAFAQTDTIFATYTYTMGDNDTKSDARQLCFLYAKRQCLEKAGTFVQSELKVRKEESQGSGGSSYNELTQQDISTFTGAFVKVDIVTEQFAYSGETMALTIKVKAIVNVSSIYDQILALRSDRDLQQKLKDQQQQIAQMESSIRELQKRLTSNSPDLIQESRVERQEAFGKISELEAIKQDIARKTKLAVENVELGMTEEEVERLLGPPRSRESHRQYAADSNTTGYNYGKVWIIFESGVVTCIVKSEFFNASKSYREDYPREAIIK